MIYYYCNNNRSYLNFKFSGKQHLTSLWYMRTIGWSLAKNMRMHWVRIFCQRQLIFWSWLMNWLINTRDSSDTCPTKQKEYKMKSSNTSSWGSTTRKKHLGAPGLAEEALVTSSTRELVEFYWSNRKRFSGSYIGFPCEVK